MEDSSRNCKRSDGGIESSTTAGFSKKMKTDDDDKLSSAESPKFRSSPPDSVKNSDDVWRFSSSGRAAYPTTSLNSSADRVVGEFSHSAAHSGGASGYSCFSNVESSEVAVKEEDSSGIADLETKSYETEGSSSTWIDNNKFRESSPSSTFKENRRDMADSSSSPPKPSTEKTTSTTTTASQISTPPPAKKKHLASAPTEEELDEFFAAAEKKDQKRFAEKYNFDVVKDAPLEGRYQWVRLKP
ncbi:Cyclin-dependent kinase inhibitor 7 [Linum perenne]